MPKITIEQTELDMVIAENVNGAQGQLLLAKGTVITSKHIRIMKTWGVTSLMVEGENDEAESDQDIVITDAMLQQASEVEAPRFKHTHLDHEVIQFLWQEKLKRRAIADFKGV